MRHAGLCACPSDAAQEIKNQCGYIVEQKGGDGAVRAFIENYIKGERTMGTVNTKSIF